MASASQKLLSSAQKLIPLEARTHIKKIPFLAPLQRRLFSKAFDGRKCIHTVDAGPAKGITFELMLPEDKSIWTGTYEYEFASKLAAAVKPGIVAYDIGGWHGFFTGVFAAQGAKAVYVFEPLPDNAGRIRRMIELNPLKKIVLHPIALGQYNGEMDLLIMPETSMAKLEMSPFNNDKQPATRLKTPVRSLDSLIHRNEILPPNLIKIDVEGAELMVLRGAADTLRYFHPELFIEVHSTALFKDCHDVLTDAGYTITVLHEHKNKQLGDSVFQIHAGVQAQ